MSENKTINQKIEKILTVVVVILIFAVGIYGFDIVQGDPFNKVFNYKVANYHTIDRCLKFSYIYSNITKKNSKVSWYFRNNLMKQYIKIKKSYDSNFYNSIGLFYSISNDFKFLYELNENNKNLTIKEKEQYESYKKQFLSELYTILMEYRDRNKTIDSFILRGNSREYFIYKIPNRIVYYPEIAELYLALTGKNMPIDDKTLNLLKYLYETFEIVYKQEKENFTPSYRTFGDLDRTGFNNKRFKEYYPYFVIDYTRNIIWFSHLLHPEINICSESDICEKYIQMSKKSGLKTDPKVIAIIEKN